MKLKLKDNWIQLLIAIDAFLTINPYFLWETYQGFGFFNIFKMIVEMGIMVLFVIKGTIRIKKSYKYMCLTFLVLYVYYVFDAYKGTLTIGLGTISKAVVILIFLLQLPESKRKIFHFFSIIFAISLIPGIIFCILNLFGINTGGDFIESTQSIKVSNNQHYLHYFGSVFRESVYYSPRFKQLCGMFDEPGMVGTVSALLLVGESFSIKKNRYLIFSLIGGILSMSFAFYLFLIIFYLLKLIVSGKIKKQYLVIGISALALVFAFRDNEILQKFVFSRLSINSLIHNNRTSSDFDKLYSSFLKDGLGTGNIFLGLGNNNPIFNFVDVSSYKLIIYNMGIIGLVLLVGWFAYWGFKWAKGNSNAIVLVLIFLFSIYQRPFVVYLFFIVILFGGIENLKSDVGTFRASVRK